MSTKTETEKRIDQLSESNKLAAIALDAVTSACNEVEFYTVDLERMRLGRRINARIDLLREAQALYEKAAQELADAVLEELEQHEPREDDRDDDRRVA